MALAENAKGWPAFLLLCPAGETAVRPADDGRAQAFYSGILISFEAGRSAHRAAAPVGIARRVLRAAFPRASSLRAQQRSDTSPRNRFARGFRAACVRPN
jgi:hypothetical protein